MTPGAKDRILDAAERVVLRDGVAHLTLDAVAAETGISKGGLLYHFPSKDDLIRGMIRRLRRLYEAEVERLAAQDPHPVGRTLRAMIRASFPEESSDQCRWMDRVAAGLLAAVALNPELLAEIREYSAEIEKRILDDGLDPVTAMTIHCAADGIWMAGLFGLNHPADSIRKQVIANLLAMSFGEEPSVAATSGDTYDARVSY
jgi:AcrR family transcriptional regulator